MRLAEFIAANIEPILEEWVKFAGTHILAAKTMDHTALRDHAHAMLKIIITYLQTPQTDREQSEKSKGKTDTGPETSDTPAEVHGAGRAASGFSLADMVSEYRALRASVLRLWTKENNNLTGADLEDLIRFNEAIDQATAESITRFTGDLDQSKEMFLAILGHDLRTPLGSVIMTSQFMLDTAELKEPHLSLMGRMLRSARRMNHMVGDLLDFTRSRLGSGIPITRKEIDLAKLARDAVDEVSAAQPGSVIEIHTSGELSGNWDEGRISQLLTNLLANAVQHGTAKAKIDVTVEGAAKEVVLRVHNTGPVIPASDFAGIFTPLKLVKTSDTAVGDSGSLGLGLYIAERIVTAHGGTIVLESSGKGGTTFTVRLPR